MKKNIQEKKHGSNLGCSRLYRQYARFIEGRHSPVRSFRTDFKPKKILGIWVGSWVAPNTQTQTQSTQITQYPTKIGSRPNLF